MKEFENILKALANRRRLAILKFLKKHKEASVGEIADEINLSFKATSKHLNILARAGLLDKDQRSLTVYYQLSPDQKLFVRAVLNDL